MSSNELSNSELTKMFGHVISAQLASVKLSLQLTYRMLELIDDQEKKDLLMLNADKAVDTLDEAVNTITKALGQA